MESDNVSNSSKAPPTLFPAYSSTVPKQEESKDWLYNSSFSESAFKQASQLINLQENETRSENAHSVPNEATPNIRQEKKRKSNKRKIYKKGYDPSTFIVPESESIFSQLKKKTFIEETGLSFERAFQTDATRDPENFMFECFERTKIANYRICLKIPIGLSFEETLHWSLTLPKKKTKGASRYFSKSFLKVIKNTASEDIFKNKESLQSGCLDYIPISVISSHLHQSVQSGAAPSFINVSSSWKIEERQMEKSIENKVSTSPLQNEIREKVIFYNKKLAESPNDIDLWLEFVDFQDHLLGQEKGLDKKSYEYSEDSIIEKKIAILEKALKYNPKDVSLNIKKLRLSQNVCDMDKLISMWDNIIFFNPNNPQVWQGYLLFVISNLTTFNTSSILKLYSKCLRTLSNLSEGVTESHQPLPDIIPNMLGIFNQLCHILKSCGYIEKAIASYQALIEFNLFGETSIEGLPASEKILYFEPFWDSGAQRIGEKNAIGWAATMQQKKISFDHISTDSDLNNMEDEILYKKLSISETWLEFERLRETHHWLPWRPNTDYDQTSDDVDDIDRRVTYDDVSKFLFCVPDEEHKFLLIIHFTTFLGFDAHFLGCHNMANRLTCNPIHVDDYEILSKQLSTSKLIHPLKNPLCFNRGRMWSEERFNFFNSIFLQVCDTFTLKYKTLLTYVWLKFRRYYALEVKSGNKESATELKKFAKGILKKSENRNCLLLWFEYIQIEWLLDRSNALKTFQTLLLSSTLAVSSGSMPLQELGYFIQCFLDIYISHPEKSSEKVLSCNEILWILIHTVNKEKYVPYSNQEISPAGILKAVTVFRNSLEKELSTLSKAQTILCYCIDPHAYSVISWTKCFAYFQYFSQGYDAALHVYENVTSFISSNIKSCWGKYILEQICIAEAGIMNYHTWNSIASIKPLQAFLCESVEKYPHNSKLLYLLVKLRNASSVINPTRRFLAQVLKNYNKSQPATWIFTLAAEFAICYTLLVQNECENQAHSINDTISGLGINWRIRSLYENMLKSDLCAHIPVLWRSYMKYEIMTQNTEKAKGIFHRALQNCGWSKELLMDGIEYFPDQLQQMLDFMSEKQIRVHTPLEEVTLLMEHAIVAS